MYAANRTPEIIDDRLIADFYAPTYIEIETRINNCGIEPIRLGTKLDRVFKGAFYLLASEYVESGIPFIRVTQITGGAVDLNATVYISQAAHHRERKTAVHPGNLLFAKGGAYRHCAVIPSTILEANISQDLIGAVTSSDLDSHYAFAFLASRFGRPQLIRWEQGDAQPHLSNDSVKHVLLPFAATLAQQYIGDKVRQAERLRSSSQQAMRLAQQLIEALISKAIREDEVNAVVARIGKPNDALDSSFGLPSIANRNGANERSLISRISGIALTERLDSGFYQKEFLENERHIQECGLPLHSIGTLCEKCNCGATPKEVVYEDIGQGLIRTTDVRPNLFLADQVLRTSRIKVSATSTVAAIAHDIVYTMSGTIGHAAVIPDGDETFSFSNTIARARLPKNSEHDPDYVAGFFNSSFGYKQSLRLTSGGIQGHVMPNPFKGLLVPTPSPTVQRFIGDLFRKANRLERFAGKLVTAAKELVTALIENHVSEADLQAAQKSLDAGNQELDRAILSQLTTGGIDVAGQPRLFADLDALYAAIDEAQRTQPSNGDTA